MKITKVRNKFQVGNLIMTASRWPWQGYGWRATGGRTAPLNVSGARFGGGWRYKLGIQVGGTTFHVDLLFGSLSFQWETDADRAAEARWQKQREELRRRSETAVPF